MSQGRDYSEESAVIVQAGESTAMVQAGDEGGSDPSGEKESEATGRGRS